MRAWKKWSDKRSEGRILIDVKLTRQFVKMHKKLYSKYRPYKEFKREYRNRNDRRRMMKKTWELIVKNVPWLPGKSFWEMTR